MAIAYDSVANGYTGSGTSLTYTHNVVGASNNILFVSFRLGGATSDIVSSVKAKVGGTLTAMTRINGSVINTNNFVAVYYLVGVDTGATSNVEIVTSSTTEILAHSVAYTGAAQTGQPDASQGAQYDASGTSHTRTVTVVNSSGDTWMVMFAEDFDDGGSAGSGTTSRSSVVYDSNGGLAAGSRTLEYVSNASARVGLRGAASFTTVSPGPAASRRMIIAA